MNSRKLVLSAGSLAFAVVLGIGPSAPRASGQQAAKVSDLERLVAIEDIKHLMARYSRFVDNRQYDEWRDTLAPDVVFEWQGTIRGNQAVADAVRKHLGDRPGCCHSPTAPEIDITSPTTATGIWRFNLFQSYYHTYEKIPGMGWRIKTWKLVNEPGRPATEAAGTSSSR